MPEVRKVAAMLIVNARGELLLQLRDDKREIRFPNHWGVIGGSVEPGESFEQAVVREALEEIEVTFTDYEYWDTHRTPGYEIAMFAARLEPPAGALVLHEGQRVEFFSPQAAMMQPLVPWLAEQLPAFVRSDVYQRLAPEAHPPGNAEAASVIFVNREGQLLLRLRDNLPGLPFPGMWDLVGGAMEEGETPEDAVVRETLEELGLVLEDFLYWGDVRGVVLIHVFLAPLDVPASSLALTEGERVEWFAPGDTGALPLVPYMQRLIPQFVSTPPYSELFGSP
jgi:8-oxo-dGTP diphosphatase